MNFSEGYDTLQPPMLNGAESGSRKSSIATQHTAHTRESAPEEQTNVNGIHNETRSISLSEFEPLQYSTLLEHGLKLTDDPDAAKQWLVDFGYHKEDTCVSQRFRVAAAEPGADGPYSLLPLFSTWIPAWYRFAVQRRKVDKLSRTASYKEQDDFDWLLKYIADYVRLGHAEWNEQELSELCINIVRVCQETGRENVINESIFILHNIIVETVVPQQALGHILELHCAGTVTLPELPPELFDNIRRLLTGPLQQAVITWLLQCMTSPTVQNNSNRLIEARGAIRQVRHHMNAKTASGSFAVELDRFLDCISQASKCCIFRFCTEILLACQSVLESEQLPQLLATDLRQFVGTIENCTRTVLPRNGSNRSFEALRSPDRTQVLESQKQNDKYFAERKNAMRQLLAALEGAWEHMDDSQAKRISDVFMENAKDLGDTQAAAVISHLAKQGLLQPGADDWSQRGTKVFESFVRNTRLSSQERINAAVLCINSAASVVSASSKEPTTSMESALVTGKHIVDRLLNMLGKEYDTPVVDGILAPLKRLTDCVDDQNKPHYAPLVISKLLHFVKTEREGENEATDDHVVLFTQAIRDIFLRGLHKNAHVTVQAFNALLEIASARCKSKRCRLAALRLLLRIRCDNHGMVYVTTAFDSEYIAAALCRTEESRAAYTQDLNMQNRSSANAGSTASSNNKQLWLYPKEASCMHDWDSETSKFVAISGAKANAEPALELSLTGWLVTVIESLQADNDWETYSFILVHLGAQIFNTKLFSTSLQAIVMLRQVLCEQIHNNSFREPPAATGLKRSDTALCMFNMLTALIPYGSMKSEKIQKGFGDDLVKAFVIGIGNTWDGTHRGCIHALSLCSFELPASVASSYPSIVQTMGKHMSQSHLTIHILEFLIQVARLPEVHSSFNQNEITQIFGICLQFLEKVRDIQSSSSLPGPSARSTTPARHSGISLRRPPYRAAIVQDVALPQYASALAYHTMIFWFLSLRLEVRAKYVSWIVPRLVWKNSKGEEVIEEQSQVLIDMMQRTAFSDIGESAPNPAFAKDSDGTVSSASWIVGLSIITAETAGHTGLTQITKRQAAGTTYASYQQLTTSMPSHHVPIMTQLRPEEVSRFGTTDMLPSHILLQMVSTATPTSIEDQPIYLPQEDYVTRALNVFDRIPTVDSHKIGVLYIGPGQTREVDYLANTATSPEFEDFVNGLGYCVSLEPPLRYNPQGLQHPRDGETTIAWRDRISEVVFHIPSMMPNNLEDDPSFNIKKSHVGNCHVVVVFNESGLPWKLDNFTSAVTLVNVIITPTNRTVTQSTTVLEQGDSADPSMEPSSATAFNIKPGDFYQVHVVTKEDYPNVSPAADPKVISADKLAAFIRMFSINANIFSTSKIAADSNDDEFPSTWRARLQAIKRLKDRVSMHNSGPSRNHSIISGTGDRIPLTSIPSGRKTPVVVRENTSSHDIDGALAQQLDFGSWTTPSDKDVA